MVVKEVSHPQEGAQMRNGLGRLQPRDGLDLGLHRPNTRAGNQETQKLHLPPEKLALCPFSQQLMRTQRIQHGLQSDQMVERVVRETEDSNIIAVDDTVACLNVFPQHEGHEALKSRGRGRQAERCAYPLIMPIGSNKGRLVNILLPHA